MWLLLVPFFSLSWLFLKGAARTAPPSSRLVWSAAGGVALAVLFTGLAGRILPDLPSAFRLSSAFAAGLSVFFFWKYRKSETARWGWSWNSGWLGPGLVTAGTSCLVFRVIERFSFHDQMRIQAHPPLIESILRGNFPAGLVAFPDIPLKYHWGSDLFAAILSYAFQLPAYRSIDWVQGFGWLTLMLSLWTLCRELKWNLFWTTVALLWIPLGAGWAWLLKPFLLPLGLPSHEAFDWAHSYVVFGRHLNPGTVSNFFMLPYSLGLPLFFVYLALLAHWLENRRWTLLGGMAVLLGTLAFVQITFFFPLLACTALVLGCQPFIEKIPWRTATAEAAVLLLLSLGLAFFLGGFFGPSREYISHPLAFNWPLGYLANATWGGREPLTNFQAALWYVSTFGSLVFLSLPALLATVLSLRKSYRPMILFLSVYAVGSFLIPQFFHYRLTWDIIKWFTSFQLGMSLLILLLASAVPRHKWLLGALVVAAAALDTRSSVKFLTDLAFFESKDVAGTNKTFYGAVIPPPSPEVQYLMGLLRKTDFKEMVFSTVGVSEMLTRYSGQAMANLDNNTVFFGVRADLLQKRRGEIHALQENFSLESLRASPIRWIIFKCDEFEKQFSPQSKQAVQEAVDTGGLTAYPPPPSGECWKVFYLKP